MEHRWSLRCPAPNDLAIPAAVDPGGRTGPTPQEARRVAFRQTSTGLFVPTSANRRVVEQRIAEEAGRLPPDGAVTGWAALRMAGGNFFDGTAGGNTALPVDLVVPPRGNLRPATGIVRHRQTLRVGDCWVRHGVRCTRPARALLDAMAYAGDLRARVRLADMALSAGLLSRSEATTQLSVRPRPLSRRLVEAALQLADSRARSPKEVDMRLIWQLDAGLPRPLGNWPVATPDGDFIASADLLCEQLAVVGEYDGADHRTARQQAEDARRDQAYAEAGLESFRIVGRDLNDVGLVVSRMVAAVRRARENPRPRRWLRMAHPPPLCDPVTGTSRPP